ncbi:uncharacterized protein [Anoplolepis gracilipes]|uniref:uncharacterized protein isoform X2 n=1 Tax=Anoplolepis gracilipes TaxID=354296 RepID=UPI003B9DFB29
MMKLGIFSPKDKGKSQDVDFANLNVHMNVNVNNSKTKDNNLKKTYRRDFILFNIYIHILIFLIIFSGIIWKTQYEENTVQIYRMLEEKVHQNLHEKIKDLEEQISNIMSRLKYTDEIINNARSRRIRSIDYSESLIDKPVNLSKIENDHDSTTLVIFETDDSMTPSASVQSLNRLNNVLKKNDSILNSIDLISPTKSENNLISDYDSKIKDLSRKKRAESMESETQNHTTKDERNDTVNIQRESRAKRQRDKGRGKKQQKGRRPKRNYRRLLYPAMITFVGQIPEFDLNKTDGPWMKSWNHASPFDFTKFHMTDGNYSIEVGISGLYMISVQIFYFGNSINHSYWMLLKSEGMSVSKKLAKCAIITNKLEGSCYTSITGYIKKGDRLSIQGQEKNGYVDLREGKSHIQLVLFADKSMIKNRSS